MPQGHEGAPRPSPKGRSAENDRWSNFKHRCGYRWFVLGRSRKANKVARTAWGVYKELDPSDTGKGWPVREETYIVFKHLIWEVLVSSSQISGARRVDPETVKVLSCPFPQVYLLHTEFKHYPMTAIIQTSHMRESIMFCFSTITKRQQGTLGLETAEDLLEDLNCNMRAESVEEEDASSERSA
jgi:hypothetical protein